MKTVQLTGILFPHLFEGAVVMSTDASAGTCESAIFPFNGQSYSRVCGRINAYQSGTPSAFRPSVLGGNPGLEGVYLEGVSLTYGDAGSRRHIWSFATALFENDPNYQSFLQDVCFCTNTNYNWPYQLPSFIGNNYFCATGNPGPGWTVAMILYGMVRDALLLTPAVISTILHGFVPLYHSPPRKILK